MSAPLCEPSCWEPTRCPTCGGGLDPRGRSAPLGSSGGQCCEDARTNPAINPRHLWSVHDEVRVITDPDGWAEHLASCDQCRSDS